MDSQPQDYPPAGGPPQEVPPPFSNQPKPRRFPPKLVKKLYESQAEKRKDFFIGVGVFIALNVVLSILLGLFTWLVIALGQNAPPGTIDSAAFILNCLGYPFTFLANILVLIYYILTRTWIGIGMLGAFAILLVLGTLLTIVLTVICFTSGSTL